MKYLIKRVTHSGEQWIWASDAEVQQIDAGQYINGGVVHCVIALKEYNTFRNYMAILEHRIEGMREAVHRWSKKLKPKDNCEDYDTGDLEHLRTEYIHKQYEDDGRWVCQKHMILRKVEPSEELGQLAFEEVMRLLPELKQENILPVKIYFCQHGWICVFDWTSQEPYL